MRTRFLPALFLLATVASAQNALRLDLSGPWRMQVQGDRPEFAEPGFDDSGWAPYELPAATTPARRMWLRKTVDLPAGTDLTNLALTLGTVHDTYELFVNGVRIGGTGGPGPLDHPIPRPLTFDIPPGIAARGGSARITLAIRAQAFRQSPLVWARVPAGPFLLTDRAGAPRDAGTTHLMERRYTRTPELVLAFLSLGMALLLLAAWLGERERQEVVWFVASLTSTSAMLLLRYMILTDSSFPQRWLEPEHLTTSLTTATFASFAVSALGFQYRWVHWFVWALWAAQPLGDLLGYTSAFGFVSRVLSVIPILIVAAWWWMRGRGMQGILGQHTLAIAIALTAIARLNTFGGAVGLPRAFFAGPFRFPFSELAPFLLSIPIAWQILARLRQNALDSQRLAGEIQAARTIQRYFLSSTPAHITAVYEPAQEVGGDFFQCFTLEDGSDLVAIGDVSGKGLQAAMVVSMMTGALRNRRSNDPASLLAELNRALAGSIERGFITAAVARCFPGGRVLLSNAGHPLPFLGGEEVQLESGLPLGITPDAEYSEREVTIRPEAQLTFVSDGVVEAENASRELFGFERTREISMRPAREIAETARAWGQNDDITVVTVRLAG